MVPRTEIPPAVWFLLATVAFALLPSKLETEKMLRATAHKDFKTIWLQSGSRVDIGDACFSSVWELELLLVGEGRAKILSDFTSFLAQPGWRRSEDPRRCVVFDAMHRGTEHFTE